MKSMKHSISVSTEQTSYKHFVVSHAFGDTCAKIEEHLMYGKWSSAVLRNCFLKIVLVESFFAKIEFQLSTRAVI